MKSYLDLMEDVMTNGESHGDRTGVGTRSVFGRQWRHDMRTGFPLMTTKKVPLRWVFEELRWFLSGSTNEQDLAKAGVSIWQEWKDEDGELGPIYPKQWRCFDGYRMVKQTFIPKPDRQEIGRVAESVADPKEPVLLSPTGPFRVIKRYTGDDNGKRRSLCDIQFENTGYVQVGVRADCVSDGRVKDRYFPSVYGVACIGEGDACHPLYDVWASMIQRCYSEKFKQFGDYGGRGVWVCDRWLVFSNFAKDASTLPNWEMKKEYPDKYSIDKDMSGCNVYSPESCVWSSCSEQAVNRKDIRVILAQKDGHSERFVHMTGFANKHGISQQMISKCLTKQGTYRGWKFNEEDNPEGFVPRYFAVDQIAKLIACINQTPNSRRIIVSAYNPGETPYMALEPCHTLFQIKVHEGGELSLHLYARSIDIFLGLPFNIASYGLLLEMLCFVTGNTPRDLIISFGDLHLYNNHFEQAKEQLVRDPYQLPTVRIDALIRETPLETLLGITWSDVKLQGYKHHPKIEAPVAV